jgi:hypothetical protein
MKKIEETKSKEDRKVSMSTGGNNEVAEIRKTRILNTSRYQRNLSESHTYSLRMPDMRQNNVVFASLTVRFLGHQMILSSSPFQRLNTC